MFELNSGDVEQSADLQTGNNESMKQGTRAALLRWDKITLALAIIALLSALAAVFVILSPLLDMVVGFMGLRFAGWTAWQAWIMEGERSLFVAVALGLIALLFAILARYRVTRDFSVYVEAGCPSCHEHELIRVHRNRKDRALSKMGLPVRRYSCRNCTWHGLRLAGYRYKINENSDGPSVSEPLVMESTEEQLELIEESVPESAGGFAAVTNAKIQSYDDDMMSDYEDASAGLVEASLRYGDEVTNDNSAGFDEPAVAVQIEAVSDDAIHDVGQEQVEAQPTVNTAGASSDLKSDQQGDTTVADTGTEPDAEDDEFARLCQEVAQSK